MRTLSTIVALAFALACSSSPPKTTELENKADKEVDESKSAPHFIILVQDTFQWMGNDTYAQPDDDVDKFVGGFPGVAAALDGAKDFEPKSTVGLLYVFAHEPKELWGGAIGELSSAALGSQKDYQDISRDFQAALRAIDDKMAPIDARKVLVIFADGGDNLEGFDANGAAERLKKGGFEVYTIHYDPSLGAPPEFKANMATIGFSGAHQAQSRDEFAPLLAKIYADAF